MQRLCQVLNCAGLCCSNEELGPGRYGHMAPSPFVYERRECQNREEQLRQQCRPARQQLALQLRRLDHGSGMTYCIPALLRCSALASLLLTPTSSHHSSAQLDTGLHPNLQTANTAVAAAVRNINMSQNFQRSEVATASRARNRLVYSVMIGQKRV